MAAPAAPARPHGAWAEYAIVYRHQPLALSPGSTGSPKEDFNIGQHFEGPEIRNPFKNS